MLEALNDNAETQPPADVLPTPHNPTGELSETCAIVTNADLRNLPTSTKGNITLDKRLVLRTRCKLFYLQHRRLCIVIGVLLALTFFGILAALLTLHIYLPIYVQQKFANINTNSGLPPTNFTSLDLNSITFHSYKVLPLNSYFDTEIEFVDAINFYTDGSVIPASIREKKMLLIGSPEKPSSGSFQTLVTSLPFPTMKFGLNKPYIINDTYVMKLVDTLEWEYLWKRWFSMAMTPDPTKTMMYREMQDKPKDTMWRITTVVNIRMLGFEWKNVPLEKFMDWNGGLTSGKSPVTLNLLDWNLYGPTSSPGIRLELQYHNDAKIGVELGDVQLDLSSLYEFNRTDDAYVHLLDVQLPNMSYLPGTRNLTIDNRFLLRNVNTVKASWQLFTNYVGNETSTVSLHNFRRIYSGTKAIQVKEAGGMWLDHVMSAISFNIQLNRVESLTKLATTKAWALGTSVSSIFTP